MHSAVTPRLPRLPLMYGSPAWSAGELAERVREVAGSAAFAPHRLVDWLGIEYLETELSADIGGQDALLLPLSTGGFRIVVDPRASARQYWWPSRRPSSDLLRSMIAFRTAHELGHLFFFAKGSPPVRRTAPTAAEETFCDLFAASMIVRERGEPTASMVATVARRFGGNIELAALWAVAAADVSVDVFASGHVERFGARSRRSRRSVTTSTLNRIDIEVAA